ncbi:transposase [Colletotrichum tabaci]|uniref:Transposase n=2 Tax=Colletotrichum tabaci TaxID=1209068 RepID=A0AAV9TCJ4_9PEZI
MADRLLRDRGARRVGTNWASNFVRRRPELQTRFNRRIDYQRVLCEDPDAYRAWFSLVRNTIAKYGIDDTDIYNFDETGFAMGKMSSEMVVTASERRGKPRGAQQGNQEWVTVIQGIGSCGYSIPPYIIFAGKVHLDSWTCNSPLPPDWVITLTENGWTTNEKGLEWVQHFDFHTRSRTKGAYRLLILDGHESHHSVDFELYCKEQNIITLCMPPHSSHKLQPLDVGCFSPLKRAYSQEIEVLMRVHITHIAKEDFLPAFYKAYDKAMTTSNIQAGFRATGLVPFFCWLTSSLGPKDAKQPN